MGSEQSDWSQAWWPYSVFPGCLRVAVAIVSVIPLSVSGPMFDSVESFFSPPLNFSPSFFQLDFKSWHGVNPWQIQILFPITLFLFFPYFALLFSPPIFSFSSSCLLFSSPFCCFSFSLSSLFFSPDFFLLFPFSLFCFFSFSPLNFFLVSPLCQGGWFETQRL